MALDWAHAAQGCQLHHQSFNPPDPRGKAEAWSTEDNLAKDCGSRNKEHTWGTIPRLAVTDRGEGASLLPYMPAGMMGSDEDDDDDELDKTCLERAGAFDNQLSSLFQSYFPHPNQSLFSLLTNCDQGSVLVECRLVIERLLV